MIRNKIISVFVFCETFVFKLVFNNYQFDLPVKCVEVT